MTKTKVTPERTWVILGDTQVPFHDPAAVELASIMIGVIKPSDIIYNGDIADFWSISRHNKSRTEILEAISFQEEIDRTITIQDKLSRFSRKSRRHMVDGNHEQRLEAFIGSGPQQVLGSLRGLSIPDLFKYRDRGWSSYSPYGEGIWVTPSLFVYHGVAVGSTPGDSVKKEISQIGASVIMGHVHRRADIRFRQGLREYRGIENGCLCQFRPSYKFMTNWAHCITVVKVYPDGSWHHEILDFIHVEDSNLLYCYYNGTRYDVPLDFDDGLSLPWNPNKIKDWSEC